MLYNVKAKDIMRKTRFELSPEDPAHEIKSLMDDHKICHLPVTVSGSLIGVICRNDAQSAYHFRGPGYLRAADFIRPSKLWVPPDTPITDVSFAMFKERFDCVPVVNRSSELVGIIHVFDLLGLLLAQMPEEDLDIPLAA